MERVPGIKRTAFVAGWIRNSTVMDCRRNCGKQLKALNFEFDLVFTSILNRSIHTAWLILEELEQMALNHGEEQVRLWRRSYNVTPPPIEESHPYYHEIYNDRKYKVCDVPLDQLPRSESLKDVLRLLPYWNERIAPSIRGKTVLISAHGNSCRALLKYLEGISDEEIINITLPTGVPFS
uniref:phosphoglycerate mutase (2,3-diphosphoglycerate-dependent) n=1 Tax=Bos mutus grunniens TaxID=30521 RepID=A0A8B9WM93_BOSMU